MTFVIPYASNITLEEEIQQPIKGYQVNRSHTPNILHQTCDIPINTLEDILNHFPFLQWHLLDPHKKTLERPFFNGMHFSIKMCLIKGSPKTFVRLSTTY